MIKQFSDITANFKKGQTNKTVAMANPVDEHSIQAAIIAKDKYGVNSILVGDEQEINNQLKKYNKNKLEFRFEHVANPKEIGKKVVELIRTGDAHIIMKGHLQTGDVIRAVLDKETGLRDGDVLSHVALLDFPKYHKILGVTDAGLMLNPDFDQKIKIIKNALTIFHGLGYDRPKVGILEANEEVNQKVPSSVEAEEIMLLQQKGEIEGCVIDGPISVDVALDKESADYKNYHSDVAGDADIVVGPNITVVSALTKALVSFADAKVAGFIVGAKCPIINNSRSTPIEEKVESILIALTLDKE